MSSLAKEKIRLLLVDDDPSFRAAQRRNLRRIPIVNGRETEVLEAPDGQTALEIIQSQELDCVLLDHKMPSGTGLFWLKKFLTEKQDLAVVMITGEGSEELAVEAMKNGAMDYLVKGGMTAPELVRTILNVLERKELLLTISEQQERLLDAERQRVMIESLGAACHHIGQPAMAINAYLQLMKDQETDEEQLAMISQCMEALMPFLPCFGSFSRSVCIARSLICPIRMLIVTLLILIRRYREREYGSEPVQRAHLIFGQQGNGSEL